MFDLQKEIVRGTYMTHFTLDDVKKREIMGAGEDEAYYYILTRIPNGDPNGEQNFWAVEKKTGNVRSGNVPDWCAVLVGIEDGVVSVIKPPFDKLTLYS